jgi:hypothetical protein
VDLMLTLLSESDPGAADCLKANRDVVGSLFPPDAFVPFERDVKAGAFNEALEPLKKAAKRHGFTR